MHQNSTKNRFSYLIVDLSNILITISDLQTIKNSSIYKLQHFWEKNGFEVLKHRNNEEGVLLKD
jgi:hypothetical protein